MHTLYYKPATLSYRYDMIIIVNDPVRFSLIAVVHHIYFISRPAELSVYIIASED